MVRRNCAAIAEFVAFPPLLFLFGYQPEKVAWVAMLAATGELDPQREVERHRTIDPSEKNGLSERANVTWLAMERVARQGCLPYKRWPAIKRMASHEEGGLQWRR